jgi:predicted RNase H-like nuclease (RuvC/YqgF family)
MTPAGYLERATELRAVASQIKDPHNRDLLVGAAEEYERIADKLMSEVKSTDAPK